MTTTPRTYLVDFSLANPLYANARLSVFAADTTTWAATETYAPLYTAPSGSAVASNPITLDSEGKWPQPIYVDRPVVIRIAGAAGPSHDTGVVGLRRSAVQSDWEPDTYYADSDVVRDGDAGEDTGSLYIAASAHTSSSSFADDLDAGLWGILVDMDQLARAAVVAASTVYVGALALTEPYANQIFQRTTRTGGLWSKGVGTIPLVINPTQPVTLLQYRLRDASSLGSVLQDWATAAPPLAAGSQSVNLTAPAGLYKYIIDLRANSDDTSIISTTNPVMVGEVRAFAGQSLAQQFIDNRPSGDTTTIASLGLSVSPWAWIWAATALNTGNVPQEADYSAINLPPTAWAQSSDAGPWNSAWAVQYQNQMIALTGVPCGLVGYAVGGTGIATWLPGYSGSGTAHYETLVSIITAAGGTFGGFLWCQGHYEARMLTSALTTTAAYRAQLALLFTSLAASFPSSGTFYQIISSIPAIGAYSGTSVTTRNQVRAVNKDYVADTAASAHVDGLDIELVADLVHYSQAGAITFANQWFRADAKKMALATYGNDGPLITSATRAYGSADIVLAVTQPNGGTAFATSGSIANQFTVYPAGTLSGALTISSVDTSDPAEIVLTLSAAPSEPAALDVWYRISPDDATIIATTIRDNVGTPGRQLALLGEPSVASIPVVVITIATIAAANAGASTTISGTYSNGLPTGLEYSTDGGLNWTTAPTPTIGSGAWSFTLASGFTVGVYRLKVRDDLTQGTGTSNTFVISQASPATLPTITNRVFSMNMANPNANLFTDTNLSVQAVVGDYVGGLQDQTGTTNFFIQATQALKPQFIANVKNGLPGLYFSGSLAQFLSIRANAPLAGTLKASTGYTIFIVYTPTTIPAVAATLFSASERARVGGFNIIRGAQILSTAVVRASRNSDAVTYQPSVAAAATVNVVAKTINRYESAGPTLKMRVNSLVEAGVVPAGLGANAFTACYIGAEGSNGIDQFYFDGYIHQIEIWNTAASDVQRDDLATYATSQWGT